MVITNFFVILWFFVYILLSFCKIGSAQVEPKANSPDSFPTGEPSEAPSGISSNWPASLQKTSPLSQPNASSRKKKIPTVTPSLFPGVTPTHVPQLFPSTAPSSPPSISPTVSPTAIPTASPTANPTSNPTEIPTLIPSTAPSSLPTASPTVAPSALPTANPSNSPTTAPTTSPTSLPTTLPSMIPSAIPSYHPTSQPSMVPTATPTTIPSNIPTLIPSTSPTASPTTSPTIIPSVSPTSSPSKIPTSKPTRLPTARPTYKPSSMPTIEPTSDPTTEPTFSPSLRPTITVGGTTNPTRIPVPAPTTIPSTAEPTPTMIPSSEPTTAPTAAYSRLLTITDRMMSCFSSCSYYGATASNVSQWTSSDYCSYYQTTGCTASIISEYSNEDITTTCPPSCLNDCADVFCSTFSVLALGGCGDTVSNTTAISTTSASCLASYRQKAGSVTYVVLNSTVWLTGIPGNFSFNGISSSSALSATRMEDHRYLSTEAVAIAAAASPTIRPTFIPRPAPTQIPRIAPTFRPVTARPSSALVTCPISKDQVLTALNSGIKSALQSAIALASCGYTSCNVTITTVTACYNTVQRRQLSSSYSVVGVYVDFLISTYAESLGYNANTVKALSSTIQSNLNTSITSRSLATLIQTQAVVLNVSGLNNADVVIKDVAVTTTSTVYIETWSPTTAPTIEPTAIPSMIPSTPTVLPTNNPTLVPSSPSRAPTSKPSSPTSSPTRSPSNRPTGRPTNAPTSPTSSPSFPLPNIDVTSHVRSCYATCSYSGSGNSSLWTNGQYCNFYKSTGCTANAVRNYSISSITTCPPSCLSACADVYCSTFSLLALGGCATSSSNLTAVNAAEKSCLASYATKSGSKTTVTLNVTLPFSGITPTTTTALATVNGFNPLKLEYRNILTSISEYTTDDEEVTLRTAGLHPIDRQLSVSSSSSDCPYSVTGGKSMLSSSVRLCITNAISQEACNGNCDVTVVEVVACYAESAHTTLKFLKITTKISVIAETLGYQSDTANEIGDTISLTLNASLASGGLSEAIISQSNILGVSGLENVAGIPYQVTATIVNIAYTSTRSPTKRPTTKPTKRPTMAPSFSPTAIPKISPTFIPIIRGRYPSFFPTRRPSVRPTAIPTRRPSVLPTKTPSRKPSLSPSLTTTRKPTFSPTKFPIISGLQANK